MYLYLQVGLFVYLGVQNLMLMREITRLQGVVSRHQEFLKGYLEG